MAGNSFLDALLVAVLLVLVTSAATVDARQYTAEERAALVLYRQGLKLEKEGQFERALEVVKKAYLVLPNQYITFNLAYIYFHLGDCTSMSTYASRLKPEKLPVKVRHTIQSMRFECELKAALGKKGIAGVSALCILYEQASGYKKVRNDIRDRLNAMLAQKPFKTDVMRQISQGRVLSNMWTRLGSILGTSRVNAIRKALMQKLVRDAFEHRNHRQAANALLGLGRAMVAAGETMANCPWNAVATASVAGCLAYLRGRKAFSSKDYDAALFAFTVAGKLTARPENRVYQGITALYMGRPGQALGLLEPVQMQAVRMGFGKAADSIKYFRLKDPDQVIDVARILAACPRSTKQCRTGMDKLVNAGIVKACAVAAYFRENPDLARPFQGRCNPAKRKISKAAPRSAALVRNVSPPPQRSYRTAAWVTAGMSAAFLGTGIGLLVVANNRLKGLSNAPDYTYTQQGLKSEVDSAHTLRRWGWISAGVGAAGVITSIVLFAIEPRSHVQAGIFVLPGSSGFTMKATF